MTQQGGCHCGAVRYEVSGTPKYTAICHCDDCRKSAGAPMVAWAAFNKDDFKLLQGEVTTFNSSGASMRSFCPRCGTGVFFVNETNLPGIVDIQSATLDDPQSYAPQIHVQAAEELHYMEGLHDLPKFERYPGAG